MAGNSFPDFGLTHEERRRAVLGHYYEQPGMDGARGEIWCYTDRFSYRAGDTITLFVSATAARLAAGPTRAYGWIKASLQHGASADHASTLVFEDGAQIDCFGSADHREAIRAFVEKRPARFTGQ